MKILHISLVKKWFDLTDSGEKTEEYREIKPYWANRLLMDVSYHVSIPEPSDKEMCLMLQCGSGLISYDFDSFDVVTATNGYGKKRPSWTRKFEGIEVREGRPEWGAEPGKKYFVIKLGKNIPFPFEKTGE